MKPVTKAEMSALWRKKHPDFRGYTNGIRTVLALNPTTGATELVDLATAVRLERTWNAARAIRRSPAQDLYALARDAYRAETEET